MPLNWIFVLDYCLKSRTCINVLYNIYIYLIPNLYGYMMMQNIFLKLMKILYVEQIVFNLLNNYS